MKKIVKLLMFSVASLSLIGCDMFGGGNSGDTSIYTSSYEPITGKFVLYSQADERVQYHDTYFDISGSRGDFSLKYYENGVLKREGKFQKIVTRADYIGQWKDTLHFNVKVGNTSEHISTYAESLDPIDQFRIIEEYQGSDKRFYLSELPYVMGTYVREGKEYKEEALDTTEKNHMTPDLANFSVALNGKFALDESHYFYFVSPRASDAHGPFFSYFQYFSPHLAKPLEGFVEGRTYTDGESRLNITYSREVLKDKSYQDIANNLVFGYYTFEQDDTMVDHFGTVDFSEGELHSFSFEHLSRKWTDAEWDEYTKNIEYHLPDAIIYEYVGGTYSNN